MRCLNHGCVLKHSYDSAPFLVLIYQGENKGSSDSNTIRK